jgi:hypothetical protein
VVITYTEPVFKRGSLVVTPKPAIGQFIDPTMIGKNLLAELLEELVGGNLRGCETITGMQLSTLTAITVDDHRPSD